jgi:hypothetical protein
LDVLETQSLHVLRELVRLVLSVSAVLLAVKFDFGPLAAIGALSLAAAAAYVVGIVIVWYVVREAGAGHDCPHSIAYQA